MTALLAAAAPLRGGGRREGKAGPERRKEEEGTRPASPRESPGTAGAGAAPRSLARPPWGPRPCSLARPARPCCAPQTLSAGLLGSVPAPRAFGRRRNAPCRPKPGAFRPEAGPGTAASPPTWRRRLRPRRSHGRFEAGGMDPGRRRKPGPAPTGAEAGRAASLARRCWEGESESHGVTSGAGGHAAPD